LLVLVIGIVVFAIGSSYIGGGDIKYTIVLSLVLGLSGTLYMLVLASWLALLAIVVRRLVWLVRVGEPIPFAPYMSVSTLVVWLWPVIQS
jgi:leader peptidase (prepilin peptidase)/N-methyltransferase